MDSKLAFFAHHRSSSFEVNNLVTINTFVFTSMRHARLRDFVCVDIFLRYSTIQKE